MLIKFLNWTEFLRQTLWDKLKQKWFNKYEVDRVE